MKSKIFASILIVGLAVTVLPYAWDVFRREVLHVHAGGGPFGYPNVINCELCGEMSFQYEGRSYRCVNCKHIESHAKTPKKYRD